MISIQGAVTHFGCLPFSPTLNSYCLCLSSGSFFREGTIPAAALLQAVARDDKLQHKQLSELDRLCRQAVRAHQHSWNTPYVCPVAETLLYVLNRTLLLDAPVSFFALIHNG
jgi:hypothetical protein